MYSEFIAHQRGLIDFFSFFVATNLLNRTCVIQGLDAVINPGTDRLKLWVLYCGEEDVRLVKAATAALAMLTEHETACRRIVDEVRLNIFIKFLA